MTARTTDDDRRASARAVTWAAWSFLIIAVGATTWSWWSGGIAYDLLRTDYDAAAKVERLRQFFAGFGPLAPAVYLGLVVIEVVVAPIPGLMLYAPGGMIFGAVWGGALSLAGNTIGAGLACLIARSVRPQWLSRWLGGATAAAPAGLDRYGGWLIFLLRLNPLTSSDMVSYAAGLTRLRVSTVMLATCAGMAPLCFAQAWLAENLIEAFPGLIYPLLVACAVYVVIVVLVLRKLAAQPQPIPEPDLPLE